LLHAYSGTVFRTYQAKSTENRLFGVPYNFGVFVMCKMYGIIEGLCASRGIKPGKMCSELGISRGMMSDLKMGRTKELSARTTKLIADYFGVTTDYLLGAETGKAPAVQTDNGPVYLENTYLRLAQGARDLGLDDEDVNAILALYTKHKQKNQ